MYQLTTNQEQREAFQDMFEYNGDGKIPNAEKICSSVNSLFTLEDATSLRDYMDDSGIDTCLEPIYRNLNSWVNRKKKS